MPRAGCTRCRHDGRDTTRRKVGTRVTVYLPNLSRLDLRLYNGWRMVIFSGVCIMPPRLSG